MEFNEIQRIVVVYGTRENIKTFLEANEQAIEEAPGDRIGLLEVRGEEKRHLKRIVWRGD